MIKKDVIRILTRVFPTTATYGSSGYECVKDEEFRLLKIDNALLNIQINGESVYLKEPLFLQEQFNLIIHNTNFWIELDSKGIGFYLQDNKAEGDIFDLEYFKYDEIESIGFHA